MGWAIDQVESHSERRGGLVWGRWEHQMCEVRYRDFNRSTVGRITVQYLACLYSVAMVPTVIPWSLPLIQYYFGLWKPWETESQLAPATWAVPPIINHFKLQDNHLQKIVLICTILTVPNTCGSVACTRRYGTCRVLFTQMEKHLIDRSWSYEMYVISLERYSHNKFSTIGIMKIVTNRAQPLIMWFSHHVYISVFMGTYFP